MSSFVRFLLLNVMLLSSIHIFAQTNNDCLSSRIITNTDNFCGVFSNDNATDSNIADNGCWTTDPIKDVWFSFTARRQGISIRVFAGNDVDDGFGSARVQVFVGECGMLQEIECFPLIANQNLDEFELFINSLDIGTEYFIRVDSKSNERGNFQLCLNSFNPLIEPFQDCPDARTLCNTEPFSVNFLSGGGLDNNELDNTCLDIFPPSERGSIWYVFQCRNPGDLVFTLTSNRELDRNTSVNPEEDLDFIVYELPNGINPNGPNDCSNRIALRCMASGITTGQSLEFNEPCLGPTGLRFGETDLEEQAGCNGAGDNNFVAPIAMTTGTSYALVVNNFSQSNFGFNLSFEGTTGTFVGPEADFTVDRTDLFCDQEIMFRDSSLAGIDGQLTYQWNFGEDALPFERTGDVGPHTIMYESFGTKFISLQVTSGDGCVSVETLDLDVGSCCDIPNSMLEVSAEPDTIDCPGDQTGVFNTILENEGNGRVQFSFDNGQNFGNRTVPSMLPSGEFTVIVQDLKGCEDQALLVIPERPPFGVAASADPLVIDLISSTTLEATLDSSIYTDIQVMWEPADFVDDENNLVTLANPVIPTNFEITAINEFGCEVSDAVFIDVDAEFEEQIFAPNAITPNGDGVNDFFKLFGSAAVAEIADLTVFNRYGELVYEGNNLPPGDDFTVGWDGTIGGTAVNPDVYAWIANVRFIDNSLIVFKGTVNLIL